jgi:hypothetical protein
LVNSAGTSGLDWVEEFPVNNKYVVYERGTGTLKWPPKEKTKQRDMEEKRRDKDKRTNGAKPKP